MPIRRRQKTTKGDFAADCDICGVQWLRSELARKADGTLVCPDDVDGRDVVTLNEGNAAAARAIEAQPRVYDGGRVAKDDYSGVVDVASAVGQVTFGNGSGH